MSPYEEALSWIRRHPGTAGARGLAKFVLSLWNDECALALRECLIGLDTERTALALRPIAHFTQHGDNQGLVEAGHALCRDLPQLRYLGQAADEAKRKLRARWIEQAFDDVAS